MGIKIRVGSWNVCNDIWHSVRRATESIISTRSGFDSRLRFLSERFSHTPFDIMCLQEVSPGMISSLQKDSAYKSFTLVAPPQSTLTPNGNNCCVLFNKKFKLVAKKYFNLREAVSTHLVGYAHQGESDIEDAFIKELRMRNSMATMLLLELPQTKTLLTVCNCHIHWNPAYADVKVFHTFLIVKELFQFVRNALERFPFVPLLLMGDFNSTPSLNSQGSPSDDQLSGVYELISKGRLSMKHPHHPAQLRKDEAFQKYPDLCVDPFQSAFKEVNGAEPAFTNKTTTFSGCIDYIFFKGLIPLSAETVPGDLRKSEVLPNGKVPSDHLLLMSEFFLV
ncbi:carbon catabolite repressor protein 4, putative [Plasmodium knowlesi strain H]|uniref:Carbon catabolite repressor protein 4, putative n=3 Tax=Plasmodium knowlesi TaxID=5850 RepID=A0A5E7WU47_PLAKH|nr:CCR4 domain-containing protein 3, putative [Plasmodium knowlesi strain H]OTN66524.1 putative Carbon catabolite repressor protein 4 [Plasmodium knowlesi]CAA9986329.1 CCR4 domain-containing protein 3, putative [Plasmodium knowlesi strain H]SBO25571.1 carbon catabolite repressor protein 4, putative [Plasmodium knowlesi strain H]SBO28313.1 carbon catabolite repressor protein 4, putative [Plasmodium knowlesi strain H]VVS75803.1 CCR4 domain-containing protein 3, putative [Plasmodium knowlesi stra